MDGADNSSSLLDLINTDVGTVINAATAVEVAKTNAQVATPAAGAGVISQSGALGMKGGTIALVLVAVLVVGVLVVRHKGG